MKRRILLVDDEVAVLLTLKAVLEISGFDVDTATSAREGRSRIKHREYEMVITDMRMEDEHAGQDVIAAAKEAPYSPAIALLTAFPVDDDALMGADKMLVKPMHTRVLLQQLESLFTRHTAAKDKRAAKKSAATAQEKIVSAAAKKEKANSSRKSAAKKAAVKLSAKGAVPEKNAAATKTQPAGKAVAKKTRISASAQTVSANKAASKAVKEAAKKSSR